MPRSISVEPPPQPWGQGKSAGSTPRLLPPPWRSGRQAGRQQQCRLQPSAHRDPSRTTGHPSISWAGTQTGGARKWEGPGQGAEKKVSLLANPEREPVKGACVCKGRPLGLAQAGSQIQLFVTGLPCCHGSMGRRGWGGGENKSAICWEGKKGRREDSVHQGGRTGYF